MSRFLRVAGCLALVVAATATGLHGPAAAAAPAVVAPPSRCTVPVAGKIAQRWAALRGEHGSLGCATGAEQAVPGRNGRRQAFERGEIATSPDHGPDMVVAAYARGAEVVVDWGVMDGPEHRTWRIHWTHNGAYAGNDGLIFRDPRSGTFSTVVGQGAGRYEFAVEGMDEETHSDRGRTVPVGVTIADHTGQTDCGAVYVVNGTHAQRWQELGGKDGILACPKNTAVPTEVFGENEGLRQPFEHGSVTTWFRQVGGKPWLASASAANHLDWVHLRWHSPEFYDRFVIEVKGKRPGTYYNRVPDFDGGFINARRADGAVSFRAFGPSEVSIRGCRTSPLGGGVDCSHQVMQVNVAPDPPRSLDLPGLTTADPATAFAKLGARQAGTVRYYACYRVADANGPDFSVYYPDRPGDDQGVHLAAMLESVRLFGQDFACPGQRPAVDLVNEALRNLRPHGTGTDHPGFSAGPVSCPARTGDYDTFLKSLMIMVYRHWDLLRAETKAHITGQLMTETGAHSEDDEKVRLCGLVDIPESENHRLLIEASKYLSNQVLLRQTGKAEFNNATNGMREYLLKTLHNFAKFDLLEFNSRPYTRYTMQGLFILHDFAEDAETRTGARIVLDYLTTKFSLSSNGMRRAGPYRRTTPNMDAGNKVYFARGSDAQTPFFMLWTGFRPTDPSFEQDMWFIAPEGEGAGWRGRDVIPEWLAHEAAIASLTWYLPPNAALRTAAARPEQPYQVAYYHGERPRLSFANENAAGGTEIYSQSKSFTISAGGMWLPSGYGLDEWYQRFQGNENYAFAQATTLMPVRNHPSAPLVWENLIRFNGRGELEPNGAGGWYVSAQRGIVNTCVQGGFACGLNLQVPKVWEQCGTPDTSKTNWQFLNLDTEACGKLGIMVAIRSTVDSEMAGKLLSGTGGFFYAAESSARSFTDFVSKTHAANAGLPEVLETGKEHTFVQPDGKKLTFFLRTPDNSYHAPQVSSVDGKPVPNWSTTPLAQGELLTSPGHDGLIVLSDKACGSRTELDFRAELKPVVRASHGTCGPAQAEAALRAAEGRWQQGKKAEAAAKGQEALALLRQISRDDPRAAVSFAQWARSPIASYLGDAEAISVLREAVSGHRMLRLREPDSREHRAYEATLELDLGIRLYNTGEKGQGTAHARVALDQVRQLAAEDKKYAPAQGQWANWPVSAYLAATGQGQEAVAVLREARELYRRLVAEQTADKDLRHRETSVLVNLGTRLWETGDRPAGLAAVLEGVDLARKLATGDEVYRPVLAEWLLNPASHYLDAGGRRPEALAAAKESVTHFTALNATDPATYGPKLAAAKRRVTELGG
ncbi:hypothetical protein [Crossiella sp. NPDC003009]